MTDLEQSGILKLIPAVDKEKNNLPLWLFKPWEPASSTLKATSSNSVIQKIASIVVAQSRTGFTFKVALPVFKQCEGP